MGMFADFENGGQKRGGGTDNEYIFNNMMKYLGSFEEYFNAREDKEDLIEKYREHDEDFTESLFVNFDDMSCTHAWNSLGEESQQWFNEQWQEDFEDLLQPPPVPPTFEELIELQHSSGHWKQEAQPMLLEFF